MSVCVVAAACVLTGVNSWGRRTDPRREISLLTRRALPISLFSRHHHARASHTSYCAVYMAACVTKHFPAYNSLMLGRVLGGIATSLLFSVFESWMVAEHNARSFDGAWMGDTFSLAFFGNGIIAIVAGIVAQFGADAMPLTQLQTSVGLWGGGYTVPFDMSLLVLGICAFVIMDRWSENYGSSTAASSSGLSLQALKAGCATIFTRREVLLCGIIASSFEGSMYSFVFIWTPVLSKGDAALPHGLVFAAFMVCCMAGSQIFALSSGAGLSLQVNLSSVISSTAVFASCSQFDDSLLLPVTSSLPTLRPASSGATQRRVRCRRRRPRGARGDRRAHSEPDRLPRL